jgi:hypothetical protein
VQCQSNELQLQVASPYLQLESVPALLVYARQGLPSAGRAAGQVHRRASLTVPHAQI